MAKPDDSIFEVLGEAGLTIENIVLLNPRSNEVCVNDEKYLKGMPKEYNGKPITYVYLSPQERNAIYAFRANMDAEHARRKQG